LRVTTRPLDCIQLWVCYKPGRDDLYTTAGAVSENLRCRDWHLVDRAESVYPLKVTVPLCGCCGLQVPTRLVEGSVFVILTPLSDIGAAFSSGRRLIHGISLSTWNGAAIGSVRLSEISATRVLMDFLYETLLTQATVETRSFCSFQRLYVGCYFHTQTIRNSIECV